MLKLISFIGPLLFLLNVQANSLRREATFDYTPSYFIYPLASEIPGLGSAAGAGLTVNNMFSTDTDFTGVKAKGDFEISVVSLLNIHLLKERLVLDVGYYDYDVVTKVFDRGQASAATSYLLPAVVGVGHFAQLTFNLNERMFEFFARAQSDQSQVKSVYGSDGTRFDNSDNQKISAKSVDFGLILDFTDHRYDPRSGLRIEGLLKNPGNSDEYSSTISIIDMNVTAYLPLGSASTWAFNYYQSDVLIKKQATTDSDQLKSVLGLNCDSIPDATAKAQCQAVEDQRIRERVEYNKYGRATPLGGSQRLGAFENGRYFAGHSRFAGTELRWNLKQENSSFNYLVMKGVRTGFQLAAFGGVGSVADDLKDIDYKLYSYGIGGRVVFKGGTVFRCDWSKGNDEQNRMTIFIDYPWGLSPVDNSTR